MEPTDMKYIMVKWKHNGPDDPVVIYSEIDADQWEHRKVEIFSDGRIGYADDEREFGGSMLGLEPWPDLTQLGSEAEFQITEIAKSEFESTWSKAIG
jgi:hypothetical protein